MINNFRKFLLENNFVDQIVDKVSSQLHCDMGGSCPLFAELATEAFIKAGIKDFYVIEGWVKSNKEKFWRQHTWIEMGDRKIDPTFSQFGNLENVKYVSKIKARYTPEQYMELSKRFPFPSKEIKRTMK